MVHSMWGCEGAEVVGSCYFSNKHCRRKEELMVDKLLGSLAAESFMAHGCGQRLRALGIEQTQS